jgi:hypothetical protein
MSFRQTGANWEHVPVNYEACHWPGCGGYTDQGYFAGTDFMLLSGDGKADGKEGMAKLPARPVLSGQWARSGSRLCVVSKGSIECAELARMQTVTMNRTMPGWEQAGFAGIGTIPRTNPQCLRCDLHANPPAGAKPSPVDIQISFMIEPSGKVRDARVSGDIPKAVADNIVRATESWLFEPGRIGGEVKEARASFQVHLTPVAPRSQPGGGVRLAPRP